MEDKMIECDGLVAYRSAILFNLFHSRLQAAAAILEEETEVTEFESRALSRTDQGLIALEATFQISFRLEIETQRRLHS
jgi:hypothetical protein